MFPVYADDCQVFKFGGCDGIPALLDAISASFFAVVWVLAIIFLAYGGVLYITAAGDKTKAETAKNALTNALIGIVIVLGLNVVLSLVRSLIGNDKAVTNPTIITGTKITLPTK